MMSTIHVNKRMCNTVYLSSYHILEIEYLNANISFEIFSKGYAGEEKAFIATQGPMSHTVNDFWRAIWHVKAPIIVMITKLKEKNKVQKDLNKLSFIVEGLNFKKYC